MNDYKTTGGKPVDPNDPQVRVYMAEMREAERKEWRKIEEAWEAQAREILYTSGVSRELAVTCTVDGRGKSAIIEVEEGGVITFDAMSRLSELFGTKFINFGSNADRFHGTDQTGADPVLLQLSISGITEISRSVHPGSPQ